MAYCHTCKKSFHHLGICRHRAMHRDKREDCEITYMHGDSNISPVAPLVISGQLKPAEKLATLSPKRMKQPNQTEREMI